MCTWSKVKLEGRALTCHQGWNHREFLADVPDMQRKPKIRCSLIGDGLHFNLIGWDCLSESANKTADNWYRYGARELVVTIYFKPKNYFSTRWVFLKIQWCQLNVLLVCCTWNESINIQIGIEKKFKLAYLEDTTSKNSKLFLENTHCTVIPYIS